MRNTACSEYDGLAPLEVKVTTKISVCARGAVMGTVTEATSSEVPPEASTPVPAGHEEVSTQPSNEEVPMVHASN